VVMTRGQVEIGKPEGFPTLPEHQFRKATSSRFESGHESAEWLFQPVSACSVDEPESPADGCSSLTP
jgi:hypothetical protein